LITTSGHFCQAVAATFKVSVVSVVKWSQHLRAASSASAKKAGGRQPEVLACIIHHPYGPAAWAKVIDAHENEVAASPSQVAVPDALFSKKFCMQDGYVD
jgi:hypothetical protein